MKYRYTAMYSVKGVVLSPTESEREIVLDPEKGVRAILSSNPEPYAIEGDRKRAVGSLLMTFFHRAGDGGATLQDRVVTELENITASRRKLTGRSPSLVLIAEGDVPSFTSEHKRDCGDFVVCLDGSGLAEIESSVDLHLRSRA